MYLFNQGYLCANLQSSPHKVTHELIEIIAFLSIISGIVLVFAHIVLIHLRGGQLLAWLLFLYRCIVWKVLVGPAAFCTIALQTVLVAPTVYFFVQYAKTVCTVMVNKSPISTKRTTSSHLKWLSTKRPQLMTLEFQVLRQAQNVPGLNQIMESQPSPPDNWNSNVNTDIDK